jgi:hypothetical protein
LMRARGRNPRAVISGQEDRSFSSSGRCYVARVKVSTG